MKFAFSKKFYDFEDHQDGAKARGLLEQPEEFALTPGPPHLIGFPPPLRPIPVKPILFDLAYDYLQFPDVSHRVPKRRKGLLGAFF